MLNKIRKVFGLKLKAPKNWANYHHEGCGVNYRGCHPNCPKDVYERTGEWTRY